MNRSPNHHHASEWALFPEFEVATTAETVACAFFFSEFEDLEAIDALEDSRVMLTMVLAFKASLISARLRFFQASWPLVLRGKSRRLSFRPMKEVESGGAKAVTMSSSIDISWQ